MRYKFTTSMIYHSFTTTLSSLFISNRFIRGISSNILSSSVITNMNSNTNCINNDQFKTPNSDFVYEPIPEYYNLKKLIIIHRHGDRAQISRFT